LRSLAINIVLIMVAGIPGTATSSRAVCRIRTHGLERPRASSPLKALAKTLM
jgi:hypothetical protein